MRNLLVVVDMQNDFIDGSLGTKEAGPLNKNNFIIFRNIHHFL